MVPNFDVLGKICLLTAYTLVQVCCLTFDHIAILYAHTYVGLCDSVAPDRPVCVQIPKRQLVWAQNNYHSFGNSSCTLNQTRGLRTMNINLKYAYLNDAILKYTARTDFKKIRHGKNTTLWPRCCIYFCCFCYVNIVLNIPIYMYGF